MAAPVDVAPLFVGTFKGLLECLRLQGVDSDQSAAAAPVRQAVQWARTEIYRRLGLTRTNQLVAISPVSNATTQDQLDRQRAEQLEIHMVKWKLLQELPVLFMHRGTGTASEVWNEEALTREVNPDELAPVLERLNQLIEDDVSLLDADEDTGPGGRSTLFAPTGECLEPGSTVYARPYNPWLRPGTSKAGRFGRGLKTEET